MKTGLKIFIVSLFVFLIPNTVFAVYLEYWEFSSFHQNINIDENGTVHVKEEILADFTNEAHVGLLRAIPYLYENENSTYETQIYFFSAIDENELPYTTNTYEENGYLNVEMRTFDNEPVQKPLTFILNYDVNSAIISFEDHDEFYWNVNGTENPVVTKKAEASIKIPSQISTDDLKLTCYTGAYGEKNTDCDWIVDHKNSTVIFFAKNQLDAYENLSIVIGFPKGVIQNTVDASSLSNNNSLSKLIGVGFPVVTFTVMFFLWYYIGRDEKTFKTTVIPHYKAPQNLSPTETGTIIDEKLDPKDLTATILDFAVRGYIKITEIKGKDYELELLKPYKTEKEFEKIILDGIFPTNTAKTKVKIGALKNKFYIHVKPANKSIMNDLVKNGYFIASPEKVRDTFFAIAGFLGFIGLGLLQIPSLILSIGLLISAGIIAFFGNYMPRKTKKGKETYYELKGLYEYINTAEKDRMKFQEDNNIIFEKLLPYAMAFGLIKKWTKAFEGILNTPPSWYYPVGGWINRPFTMYYFADSLSSMTNNLTTDFMARPGSRGGGAWSGGSGFGGGGFSGGGFGGGGSHGL